MICSRPALVSAATSASAYGVKSIGSVAVEARSSDSHCAAATLGCSYCLSEQVELPPTAYLLVITLTSDSSAGSTAQVRSSCAAHCWPTSSSVPSLPPAARLLASEFVASVAPHIPCCGASMSGQIHATFSGSGFATPFPGQ